MAKYNLNEQNDIPSTGSCNFANVRRRLDGDSDHR